MADKALNYLGIMRKAGACAAGETDCGSSCRVSVPDSQLSLATGKEGQNARLAARLTSCKIDIKPASYHEGEAAE